MLTAPFSQQQGMTLKRGNEAILTLTSRILLPVNRKVIAASPAAKVIFIAWSYEMTQINSCSQSHDPLVRFYHVGCALGTCEASIQAMVKQGRLPKPDANQGRYRQWRLSTLRIANPALADSVEILLKLPKTAAA